MSLRTRILSTERTEIMWYFAWLLGLPLAAVFAVMNAMWLELKEDERIIASVPPPAPRP